MREGRLPPGALPGNAPSGTACQESPFTSSLALRNTWATA
jgi:hypothetical protein